MKLVASRLVCGWMTLLLAATGYAQQLPRTVYVYPPGTDAENVMMASVAGLANRATNGEVLLSRDNGALPNPRFWLDQLKLRYPQVQSDIRSDPTFFINRYRSLLGGYVLYDFSANPDSVNMATSIAGVTGSIIVDPSTLHYATAAGLTQVADTRTMTYSQVYSQYGSQFNKDKIFHVVPLQKDQIRDYAIENQGFMYYSDPTALGPYAGSQDHQGRIYGWAADEYQFFKQASQNNQQAVASDWASSTSTTSRWQIPLAKQQTHASGAEVKAGKHYVAFVMSDGDNVQWLTNDVPTNTKWFGSPYRGEFDMTWDLTSTLGEMSPIALNYFYENATKGTHEDLFVSSGGSGLTFPSQYPDIDGLADSINQSLKDADQKVISILDPTYNATKLHTILNEPEVMGIMFKTYGDHYKGRDGAIEFYRGKPIVSVKYSLWDGADSARSIADALNNDPHRDPFNDVDSYTIVNVHPWSNAGPLGDGTGTPMFNLHWLINRWLDEDKVEVVTLEELMAGLRNNFGTPVALLGDYNDDGTIDAADYVVWRDALAAGSTDLTNDPTPGAVDESDYQYWRVHFGERSGAVGGSLSALPVPEPGAGAGVLLLLGMAYLTPPALAARGRQIPPTGETGPAGLR